MPAKILHIIASADPAAGGPIEGIVRQEEMTRSVAQRTIATLDQRGAAFIAERPQDIIPLGNGKVRGPLARPMNHYGFTPKFIPWLRDNGRQYDAIIVNGLWNFSTFSAATVLPKLGVPYFVFTHGMLDPWFRKTYPLKHLAKILFWLFYEGRLLASAERVFFTSEDERVLARGQFPFWKYREEVVGYGTAAPPLENPDQSDAFRAKTRDLDGRPYLLFLSRIHRKKGCDLLVEAFAAIASARPDLDLVIAGPDQENWTEALWQRASELAIEKRIHFPGLLTGEAKWGAYRGAEAFVLPSHQENFGIVVAEALGCGVPVLITNKVNIWREIEAAKAGLIEDDTADGIARLLRAWLTIPDEQRAKMRGAARRLFEAKFDLEKIAPLTIERIIEAARAKS